MRALAAVLALALVACAREERFPEAPILIVCPWAAGGGSDRVARQLAVLLEQDLGVPVNVVNATGGDGVTGHSRGALARPDGYTMTLVTSEIATLHWRGMTSVSHPDFAPVGLVNRDAGAIFVRADAPWRTLARPGAGDPRRRPGSLRASGTATAGIWHLALAGWLSAVGLQPTDVTWVSIAGSAPSLQELMRGRPRPRGVQPAGSAGAALVRPHPQPRRDGRGARCRSFPTCRRSRSRGSTGRWARCAALAVPKATPPARAAAPGRRGRGASSRATSTARRCSGRLHAGLRGPGRSFARHPRPRRTSAWARSWRATRFADSGRKPIGPMFFPTLIADRPRRWSRQRSC